MVVVKSKCIKEAYISIRKELKSKNLRGEVIGIQEIYVPGIRRTTLDLDECKYCGYRQESTKTYDYEGA